MNSLFPRLILIMAFIAAMVNQLGCTANFFWVALVWTLKPDLQICGDAQSAKYWCIRKWGKECTCPSPWSISPYHRISESNNDPGVRHSEDKETRGQMNTEV